jgi:hypothetical protein
VRNVHEDAAVVQERPSRTPEEADADGHHHPRLTLDLVRRRGLLAGVAAAAGAAFPTLAAATATAPRPGTVAFRPGLFRSFFLGGFECSAHRRADGRRLDLIAATRHDALAEQDYRQLAGHGIRAARDGVRWHLVEAGAPGRYDWSSFLPMLPRGGGGGHPGRLGPVPLRLAGRARRVLGRLRRPPGPLRRRLRPPAPRGDRPAARGLPGERDLLPGLGRRRHGPDEPRGARARARAEAPARARRHRRHHAVREAAPGARVLAIDPVIHVVPRPGRDPGPAAAYTERSSRPGTCSPGGWSPASAAGRGCSTWWG